MKSTHACRHVAAGDRPASGLKTGLPLLIGGGLLLLAGCAGGAGSAPVAQNAATVRPVPAKSQVHAVSVALGNRLDQMLAQQMALSTR